MRHGWNDGAGEFDPAEEVAEVCERRLVAACRLCIWGLFFLLGGRGCSRVLREARGRMRGFERARSVTVDPHKMMSAPVMCRFLLMQDMRVLREANRAEVGYLFRADARKET